MEIMKIGGMLLLVALALWIIKSLFDWWGERRDFKKWWEQYKTKTNSWDERRGELKSNHESEDDNARQAERNVLDRDADEREEMRQRHTVLTKTPTFSLLEDSCSTGAACTFDAACR